MIENDQRGRTIKLPLAATVFRRFGRGNGWTAEAGNGRYGAQWMADGRTEKDAADKLTNRLAFWLTQYRAPEVVTRDGCTVVVSVMPGDEIQNADGHDVTRVLWRYLTVHPDGRTGECVGSAASWDEAIAYARWELANLTTDWHDDSSVHAAAAYLAVNERITNADGRDYTPRRLYEYAAWQRAAKHAIDAGIDDYHRWACENASKFVIARGIPTKPDGNRPDEWRTADVILRVHSNYRGRNVSLGVGYIGPNGENRRVQDGPMEPGPWAYTFPVSSVIGLYQVSDPPDEIDARAGDRFWIQGELFELRDDKRGDYPYLAHIPPAGQ